MIARASQLQLEVRDSEQPALETSSSTSPVLEKIRAAKAVIVATVTGCATAASGSF